MGRAPAAGAVNRSVERLAAAPITWGVCELPDWGAFPPYARVLDEMAATGFRGTELGPEGYLPTDGDELRQCLTGRGLSLVGAFCPLRLYDPATAPDDLRAARTLGATLADQGATILIAADAGDTHRRAIAGRVTAGDGLSGDQWARLADGLVTLAGDCQRLGLRLVFHPHAGSHVETGGEVERLLAMTPAEAVGLCLDTGHLAYGGADPVEVCRRHADRVWHVHAKDVRPEVLARVRQDGLAYAAAVGAGVFAPLGDGMVDFPGLIGSLDAAGYAGWYVLEQDVRLGPPWPAQDPLANAQRSAAYLRGLLAGQGGG